MLHLKSDLLLLMWSSLLQGPQPQQEIGGKKKKVLQFKTPTETNVEWIFALEISQMSHINSDLIQMIWWILPHIFF